MSRGPDAREPAARVRAVTAAYRERTGNLPQGVFFAPGRVNLIGEHTDYNDGFVLPLALAQGAAVAAAPAADNLSRAWSTGEDEAVTFTAADVVPGAVDGWGGYVAGTVWALRVGDSPVAVPELDLLVDSDVPSGAGLSSSAALECSVALAVVALAGTGTGVDTDAGMDGLALALAAKRAENDFVGAPTGYMDQMASMLARTGHALFIDTRSLEYQQVPLDLAAAGLTLLVVDSRATHTHADGEYADRRRSCEQAADELGVRALRDVPLDGLDEALARLSSDELRRRVRHIVSEDARVLECVWRLRAAAAGDGDVRAVGELLTASHASMRDDFQITVAEVDVLVDAAVAAGAHGARMTGGGFGGCVLALVDDDAADRVAHAMTAAATGAGHAEPVVYPARPGPGAHRLQ